MKDTILKFRKAEEAERLAAFGFNYVIDNASGNKEYAFAFNNDIAKVLVDNFNPKDYYFTNKLCFTSISVTNAKQKGGDSDGQG